MPSLHDQTSTAAGVPAVGTPTDTAAHTLAAEGLSLGYGRESIIRALDVRIPPGRITVIVGANASGKSTLLRGMARLLTPHSGRVLLDGRDVRTLSPRAVARSVGILPQSPVAPEGITVGDLVARGRFPHQGWFRRRTEADDRAVTTALEAAAATGLVDRRVDALSGGQRQRVWLAMVLAQETDILLLDEPTTYLDIAHQVELLELVADLNERRGCTVVMVLHDLNQAARYADHLIAMRDGAIVTEGPPELVVDERMVRDVFGLDCRVMPDPVSGTPVVVPLGRRRRAGHSGAATHDDAPGAPAGHRPEPRPAVSAPPSAPAPVEATP